MKKFVFPMMLVCVLFLIPPISAQSQCLQTAEDNPEILYYFYGDGCPHCAAAEPFLLELQQKYNFTIIYHETWYNSSNQQIFEEFLTS